MSEGPQSSCLRFLKEGYKIVEIINAKGNGEYYLMRYPGGSKERIWKSTAHALIRDHKLIQSGCDGLDTWELPEDQLIPGVKNGPLWRWWKKK